MGKEKGGSINEMQKYLRPHKNAIPRYSPPPLNNEACWLSAVREQANRFRPSKWILVDDQGDKLAAIYRGLGVSRIRIHISAERTRLSALLTNCLFW